MVHPLHIQENEPWYKNGLKFQCTECGRCCSGFPGAVWISKEETVAIANYLNITETEFLQDYTRLIDGKLSLVEREKNYECTFLKQNRCSIYPVRPKQCRTFPWWPQNLKSKKDWEEAALYCEGIQANAPLIPLSTIEQQLLIQEGNSCSTQLK